MPACLKKQKSQAVGQGRGGPEDLHPVCHLTGLPAAGTQPPESRERHFRRCSPTYNAESELPGEGITEGQALQELQ